MNGTANYGEPVVIVEVNSGHVSLKTGRIASTEVSHVHADNRTKTMVWGDRKLRPECPEEAHERYFHVDNIHLLRHEELERLSTLEGAQDWFGSIYQDHMVTKIHRALKRLQAK